MTTAWYERSFGPDYMVIYRHRDWEQAAREAQQMAGWLHLPANARLLDIGCGMGRHAMALSQLGYEVTGIDLSEALLEEARKHSFGNVTFMQGDMRRLPFAEAQFQATVNLFTSFGYFREETDNAVVLGEIRRVLAPGGKFLIDFLNPVYVEQQLVPFSERVDEETGLHIEEARQIIGGWVIKQIHVYSASGDSRRYEERVRLFPLQWFEDMLNRNGLRLEKVYGGYDGGPYEEASSPRMIMTGRVEG
ncbi:class I SAM-dependent methyltransferase [Paenibacillus sp. GCM10027626]|uniref:class I SAM-dependent methyltransferase n=1 Tax=Paenibacillus sp. GCM10027626 TaxID=3273411 RepID=UPI00362C94AD